MARPWVGAHMLLDLVCLFDAGQVRFTPCVTSLFPLRRNDKVAHIYPGDVASKRLSGILFKMTLM